MTDCSATQFWQSSGFHQKSMSKQMKLLHLSLKHSHLESELQKFLSRTSELWKYDQNMGLFFSATYLKVFHDIYIYAYDFLVLTNISWFFLCSKIKPEYATACSGGNVIGFSNTRRSWQALLWKSFASDCPNLFSLFSLFARAQVISLTFHFHFHFLFSDLLSHF